MNLSEISPKEIDTILARIWEKKNSLSYDVFNQKGYIEREEKRNTRPFMEWTQKSIDREYEKLEKMQKEIQALREEEKPYNAEYARRPWSRFFLVINANGHVHKSRSCVTCFPTTQYGWLYEMSGMTEEEAVAERGEQMCTECFPSAPTLAKIMGPSKYAKMEADKKAAREKEKAEKAAKKAEKAITAPDGSLLKNTRGGRIETVWAAKYELNMFMEAIVREEKHPMPHNREERLKEANENVDLMATALSAKLGLSKEEILKKARKKAERELKNYY
jgi:hypothetical protein